MIYKLIREQLIFNENSFDKCKQLKEIIIPESVKRIESYAFQNCTALEDVSLPETLSEIVSMPFAGCTKLQDVNFNSSPNFVCEEAIIKGKVEDGAITRIVECLEGRGVTVGAARLDADDFAGVTTIDPKAFQNCTGIREAYLDESELTVIPDYCFDGATSLYYCSLSDTVKKIGKYAFRNTALSTISVPESVQSIDDLAYVVAIGLDTGENDLLKVSFQIANTSGSGSSSGGSSANSEHQFYSFTEL